MNFIKLKFQSQLFKITSLSSASVALKIGIGLITSKILAVFIGPNGMALVGNFRNFVTSLETLSTLGFQNGIVKYIGENREQPSALEKYISTIVISISLVSLLLGLILFVFSEYWNDFVFGKLQDYSFVFKGYAFAIPFYALSIALIAIVNGLEKFKNVIYISIIGNVLGLLVTLILVTQMQILGALLAIILTPSLLFFISIYYVSKEINVLKLVRWSSFDCKILKELSHFFLMALVSGVVGSFVYLEVRKNLIQEVGLQEAGFWEAISRISTYYLLFVTTIVTVYFLPKLISSTTNQTTKKVLFKYWKMIVPLVLIGLLLVYYLRFMVVELLFSAEFLPVSKLFFWQLVGDFFKCIALILGYLLYARRNTTAFIVTELLSLFTMYFSSLFFVKVYGLEGVVMAHAFTFGFYTLVLAIYFRKVIF